MKIKLLKEEFSKGIEQKTKEFEKKISQFQLDYQEKYQKQIKAHDEKMKKENEAKSIEDNKNFEEKLKMLFEKLHNEYEIQLAELKQKLFAKEKVVQELENGLKAYSREIDKWKERYLENISKKQDIIKEETETFINNSFLGEAENISNNVNKNENTFIFQIEHPHLNDDRSLKQEKYTEVNYENDINKDKEKESLIDTEHKKQLEESETQTENFDNFSDQNSYLDKEEIQRVICIPIQQFEEKFGNVVDSQKSLMLFYQNSLKKCITKIKEYQLYIKNIS